MTRYGVEVGGKLATGWFDSRQFAQYEAATLRHQGHKRVRVVTRKGNPSGGRVTKAQKREKSKIKAAKRRVAVALAKFLKQANPAMKTAGATVTRLKGGGFTIRPIKAVKRGRR
jgi:hypothetical protein